MRWVSNIWLGLFRGLKNPVGLASITFILGFILARLLPPFVLDDLFWRAFWSGPPAAGIFAVLAASLAYAASVHSAGIAKETADNENAGKQVEWAIEMALSDSSTRREIGLSFIFVLLGKSGPILDELLYHVVRDSPGAPVDDEEPEGDNAIKVGDENAS